MKFRKPEIQSWASGTATSANTLRVLETASPPTFYLPPDSIDWDLLQAASGQSFCEWKGAAQYWAVRGDNSAPVGWSYPSPSRAFVQIADFISFYPSRLNCTVNGEAVRPQPGGFYGGWLTDEISGPVKGDPGTGHW